MGRILVLGLTMLLLVRPAIAQTNDIIVNDALKILGVSAAVQAMRENCAEPIATAPPLGEAFDAWTERNREWSVVALSAIGNRNGVSAYIVNSVREQWRAKARDNFEHGKDVADVCINLVMLINAGGMDIASGMAEESTRLNEAARGQWPLPEAGPELDTAIDPAPVRNAMKLLAIFALRKEMATRCSAAVTDDPNVDFEADYQWWHDDNAEFETAARAVLDKWGAASPARDEKLLADARAIADAEFAESPDALECYDYLRFEPEDNDIIDAFPAEADAVRKATKAGP